MSFYGHVDGVYVRIACPVFLWLENVGQPIRSRRVSSRYAMGTLESGGGAKAFDHAQGCLVGIALGLRARDARVRWVGHTHESSCHDKATRTGAIARD